MKTSVTRKTLIYHLASQSFVAESFQDTFLGSR